MLWGSQVSLHFEGAQALAEDAVAVQCNGVALHVAITDIDGEGGGGGG